MQVNSNIILSIRDEVQTQLGTMGYNAFLTEADLYAQTAAPADKRYIYIVDENIEPTSTICPLTVIEVQPIEGQTFELGNRAGRQFTVFFHCFGRTRGEAREIASYFQDNLNQGIAFNDYTSGSAVDYGYGKIERMASKPNVYSYPIPDNKMYARDVTNWYVVEFDARTKV